MARNFSMAVSQADASAVAAAQIAQYEQQMEQQSKAQLGHLLLFQNDPSHNRPMMTSSPMQCQNKLNSHSPGNETTTAHDRIIENASASIVEEAASAAMAAIAAGTMKRNDIGTSNRPENQIPDDSKILANPKGIIKSYLSHAAELDRDKFEAYRKLCLEHIEEYYKHQQGGILAVCRLCNNVYRHWHTLQRHLQSHIDFRPFACDACSRTFYSQSKLKRHLIVHSDVKPFQCPYCERRLGRTEHLKRHLLVHTDAKPYGCSACAHTTKRLDGIRRHIKRKHAADGAEIVTLVLPPSDSTPMRMEPPNPDAPPKAKKKKVPTATLR